MTKYPPRPLLDQYLYRLVDELVRDNPQSLSHIRSSSILFVAGAARRTNRASIRPFRYSSKSEDADYVKPHVQVDGRRILYEICLRPLFFLEGTTDTRISTIAHELWHISDKFDGTLEESRRHKNKSQTEFEREVTQILKNAQISENVRKIFSYEGELLLQAWRQRPPSRIKTGSNERTMYDESDLYRSVVIQKNDSLIK